MTTDALFTFEDDDPSCDPGWTLRADPSLTSKKAIPYTADPMQFNEDPARVTSDPAVRKALRRSDLYVIEPRAFHSARVSSEHCLRSLR